MTRPATNIRRGRFVPADIDLDTNPFSLPDDKAVFDMREQEAQEELKRKKLNRQTRLQDRNCKVLPTLKQERAQTALKSRTSLMFEDENYIKPVGPEYQCREELHEFVDQKREIFMVQLLIDRKQKEIDRIYQHKRNEKAAIADQKTKHAELKNQYKMTMNQYEANLQRGKRAMESAMKKRSSLADELKRKKFAVEVMERDLNTNEEVVEQYRRYEAFLKKFDADIPRKRLYSHPQVLLQEMEALENENLFLIQKCSELSNNRDRGVSLIEEELTKALRETDSVMAQQSRLKNVALMDTRTEQIARDSDTVDSELARLTKLIRSSYIECFNKKADITALMMLERLENEMEQMYHIAETIPQQLVMEKQSVIDKARREEKRRQKQEAQEREAHKKMMAALDRSRKPVNKRAGRPLMTRLVPIAAGRHNRDIKKHDDELHEKFLFGEIEY